MAIPRRTLPGKKSMKPIRSIKSIRSIESVQPIRPMLAVSGQPFSAPGWIFEPKIDGTRCIAHVSSQVVLQNRRLTDISPRYPEIMASLKKGACQACVLDGEIAVFSGGLPDFGGLEVRVHQTRPLRIEYLAESRPATYIVFDILWAGGQEVMARPLQERKEILSRVLQEDDRLVITDYLDEDGEAYFGAAARMGLEGVVAKRLSSPYQPGTRSPDWVKIKKKLTADLVVGGYIPGKGRREPYFGGLLTGAYNSSGELVYLGRVGSGFSEGELKEIVSGFEETEVSPFARPPPTPGVRWLKPEMVVEVTALELTPDGHMRAPVFLRMRGEKEPRECLLDQVRKSISSP
ncbi:MAG: hypothetical protein GKC10_08380 [Methanosarcinales archaeon]|nr:hypothetical protein [Methanosarcinales archaeon]